MSRARTCARALTRHAAAILPDSRAEWGRAMQAEIDHIDGDAAALSWAAGCVRASYLERGGASLTGLRLARIVLAALIAGYVAMRLPAAFKTWSIMTGQYFERGPDGFRPVTTGVQMTASLSPWFLAVFLVHSALYLCAAAMLAFGGRRAADAFLLALGVQFAGWLALRAHPVISLAFNGEELRRDIAIFAVLAVTAGAMALLTCMTRQARERAASRKALRARRKAESQRPHPPAR